MTEYNLASEIQKVADAVSKPAFTKPVGLDWTAFAAALPPAGPVLVTWIDPNKAMFEELPAEAFERMQVSATDEFFWQEVEVLYAEREVFGGLTLYRGRAKEQLSRQEMQRIADHGKWFGVVQELQERPAFEGIGLCLFNDTNALVRT